MKRSRKLQTTLIAGAALVAAGAFVAALGEETAVGPTVPTVLSSGMTLGDSATTTTEVPTQLPTPVAQPVVKAAVPCGFTSGC